MNRTEYMAYVYASDLDAASKSIMIYYAYRKHWKNDGLVWVSSETIAKETGLSQRTVKDRIPKLRDAGWLVDTGQRVPNGKGRPSIKYDIGAGDALKVGNISARPAPKVGDFGANGEGLKCKNEGTLVQNVQDFGAAVAQEQVKEQVKNKKEEQVKTATVPDGPVDPWTYKVRKSPQPSLNSMESVYFLNLEELVPSTNEGTGAVPPKRYLNGLEKKVFDRYMDLYGVDEEKAAEALRIIQGTSGTKEIEEAVREALESLGQAIHRELAW